MSQLARTSKDQERQLIDRARAGDQSALRTLIDLHKDRLFAFVRRLVRHHHDAEEVCQDAFLKAFSSLDSFSSQYRFSTWLFTIAYRVALNQIRRRKSLTGEMEFSLVASPDSSAEARLESEEAASLRRQVWSAVDQLTEPQRAALVLFYRHECGCQEISRILGVPVATVKSHLHRARARLRDLLAPVTDKDLEIYRNVSGFAG